MKGFKKLLTGILAATMIMGASITAFANEGAQAGIEQTVGAGTITIENAQWEQTYNAYRVFDYVPSEVDNAKEAGGIYKLSSKFAGFTYDSFFTVGEKGILSFTDGLTEADAALFGKLVIAYAKANNIEADGSATVGAKPENGAAATSATIAVSAFGYYVVDSTLGTAVAVNTTTPNVEVSEKNDVPNLEKTVEEATTGVTDLTGNNAQIGDTVTFKVVASLKKGGTNYKIVDTMDPGLTFGEIVSVTFSDATKAVAHTEEYKNKGFEMSFETPVESVDVTVIYTAVVNVNAKINPDGNINEAYLVYGNNAETTHKQTETKTYPIEIRKIRLVEGATKEQKLVAAVIPGAKFMLYRKNGNAQVTFSVSEDGYTYTVDPNGAVTEIETKAEKAIKINGLDLETYVLVETKAPDGYNLLASSVTVGNTEYKHAQEITVEENSTVSAPTVAIVEDGTGSVLPSTGGIGTTIFYILGGILIVAGVAYFIVRRKSQAE